jgi:RNA polymerase sigma factor (sigma-70 family)
MADDPEQGARPDREVLATLVENHREFLGFVERRVGSRAVAEDILQSAFVKNLDKLDSIQHSAVGWFYRVLRNAIIDHHRRSAVAGKRDEQYASEHATDAPVSSGDELHAVVCACVGQLAATLKPEYAEALRRIEIDGVSVKDYAAEAGLSASNAGVRVFRAREALRRQVARACGTCATHGCLDCTCGSPGAAPASSR